MTKRLFDFFETHAQRIILKRNMCNKPEAFRWDWSAEPWREAPRAFDAKCQARRAWHGAKRLTEARSADRTVKRSERSPLL